jgi:hypothetical protein
MFQFCSQDCSEFSPTRCGAGRRAGLALRSPIGALSGVDNIRRDVDLVPVRVNYRRGGRAIANY